MVIGNLTVRVLTEGVHSGAASGIVPSSFRIARQLLSRIEDEASGADETAMPCSSQIPPERMDQAKAAAEILGDEVYTEAAFRRRHEADGGRQSGATDPEPHLAAATGGHGMDGYPTAGKWRQCAAAFHHAEIVAAPAAHLRARTGAAAVKKVLEENPPYGAEVTFDAPRGENGWNAPALAPWLAKALDKASNAAFRQAAWLSWAKAARSPSWRCWARNFPRPSSW